MHGTEVKPINPQYIVILSPLTLQKKKNVPVDLQAAVMVFLTIFLFEDMHINYVVPIIT